MKYTEKKENTRKTGNSGMLRLQTCKNTSMRKYQYKTKTTLVKVFCQGNKYN